jgi:hypothetical protein
VSNNVEYTVPTCASCDDGRCEQVGVQNDVSGNRITAATPACSTATPTNDCCDPVDVSANNVGYEAPMCPEVCSIEDQGHIWPDLGTLHPLTQVDQYGSLGFIGYDRMAVRHGSCDQCEYIDFCDGPTAEGVALENIYDRYYTRWGASLIDGSLTYGLVGETWIPVSTELYPTIPDDMHGIGLCFDANARACFVSHLRDTDTVELRRFVASTPTTYSWAGQSPKLFYNGNLQFDQWTHEVVCYYLRSGRLYARFQRDNFLVEYLIAGGVHLSSINRTDRGSGSTYSAQLIAARAYGICVMLVSDNYSPFPCSERDSGSLHAAITGGLYMPIVYDLGTVAESASLAITLGNGVYFLTIVSPPSPNSETMSLVTAITGGLYFSTVVVVSAISETGSLVTTLTGGNYFLVIVSGDSYAETGSLAAAITGGTYAIP